MKHTEKNKPCAANCSARTGLTAIELLAASALAALMTVAVSGILGAMALQRRELPTSQTSAAWQRRLAEQVRWDFSNARQFRCNGEELMLSGFGAREFGFTSRRPTHRPAQISYRIKKIGERHWLIRRETHLDERALVNFRSEIVCADADRIDVQPVGAVGDAGADGTIPRQARFTLRSALDGEEALDVVLQVY